MVVKATLVVSQIAKQTTWTSQWRTLYPRGWYFVSPATSHGSTLKVNEVFIKEIQKKTHLDEDRRSTAAEQW